MRRVAVARARDVVVGRRWRWVGGECGTADRFGLCLGSVFVLLFFVGFVFFLGLVLIFVVVAVTGGTAPVRLGRGHAAGVAAGVAASGAAPPGPRPRSRPLAAAIAVSWVSFGLRTSMKKQASVTEKEGVAPHHG